MSSYCVTGAGTAGANGQYDEDPSHAAYQQFNHVDGTDFRLVYTGYYELRSGANPFVTPATTDNGYYFDNSGAGGSYLQLDSVNTQGSLPIPTVVVGACASESGTTTATSSAAQTNDMLFALTVIIFMLGFMFWGFVINNVLAKKDAVRLG